MNTDKKKYLARETHERNEKGKAAERSSFYFRAFRVFRGQNYSIPRYSSVFIYV